jgi:predicted subunit of tRNA(5-methylaminomethyl-2-thiouridylate) methyltransferase
MTSLEKKIQGALALIDQAVETYKPIAMFAMFAMFSGGHDSLTSTHIAARHPLFSGAAHMNTGIGIEQTRKFVRETCKQFGWPLREIRAREDAGQDYEKEVLLHGFPGPGAHKIMYSKLKERPLRMLIRETKQKWRDRVLLVTGIRSEESRIRMGYSEHVRRGEGTVIWANHRQACMKTFLADKQPGEELDKRIAKALGLVPCDAWSLVMPDTQGGTYRKGECGHSEGACYAVQTGAPRYSRSDAMAMDLLRQLTASPMGWRFDIQIGRNDCSIYANAGDSNCPHGKQYDPKGGCGYSYVETELETDKFAHAAALVAWRCLGIKPGETR